MIKIENPALYDGRAYGNIIKEDFAAARRVLSPETTLDWVELALQRDGFEWKHPDCISRQSIKEMERAGYLRTYGVEDWLFSTEKSGNTGGYNSAPVDDYDSYIAASKAQPPDPKRIFKNTEPEHPERCFEYEIDEDNTVFAHDLLSGKRFEVDYQHDGACYTEDGYHYYPLTDAPANPKWKQYPVADEEDLLF